MITVSNSGSFKKTLQFLDLLTSGDLYNDLEYYGRLGVSELEKATPIDTGETAKSWGYQINHKKGGYFAISWFNTHRENDVNIAVIVQYGHATGNGAYIQGVDYINPAIRPVFDKIVDEVWRKVTNG